METKLKSAGGENLGEQQNEHGWSLLNLIETINLASYQLTRNQYNHHFPRDNHLHKSIQPLKDHSLQDCVAE